MFWKILIPIFGIALLVGCQVSDKSVISQAQDTNATLEPAVIEDKNINAYFQKIGQRIVAAAKQLDAQGFGPDSHKNGEDDSWMYSGVQFHCVNSKTLNAFTTGGHHVYIYNELFQSCKNEDELAAVMSHEYAHIYCRHVAKGMQRQQALLVGTGAGAVGGYLLGGKEHGGDYAGIGAAIAGGAGQFIGMGFTREDEDQADEIGFAFYTRAGWDPKQFAGFFKTMIAKGLDSTPELASDHPKLANRVEKTNERIKKLPPDAARWRKPPIFDAAKFQAYQKRANQIAKKTPDDTSLQKAQLMFTAFPSCVSPAEQPDQQHAQKIIYQAIQERKRQSEPKKN